MDRWIWAAWRAFWVGLGASVVIIGQSILAPAPAPAAAAPPAFEQLEATPKKSAPAVDPARVSSVKVRTRTAS